MRLPKRDIIATVFVACAALVYLLWAANTALPGIGSARIAGLVVLAFGLAASATAVVPTFGALLHGNKAYLAITSLLGVAAFVGGLLTLISGSAAGFAIMIAATVALWLISTVHHRTPSRAAAHRSCPNCGQAVRELRCDLCGYEVIEKALHVRGL